MIRNDVVLALMRGGYYRGAWSLDDNRFDPISSAFVVQAWQAWVESLPDELKQLMEVGGGKSIMVPKWIEEVFDCDNHVKDFLVFLDRCMAIEASKKTKARGNAGAGRFNFFRNGDPKLGHCRAWFIDYTAGARAFDPGNCQLDGMSQPEMQSIFGGESV